jgi:hypothetical protein
MREDFGSGFVCDSGGLYDTRAYFGGEQVYFYGPNLNQIGMQSTPTLTNGADRITVRG